MPHSTSKTIRIAPLRLPHAGLIRLCEVASASLDRLPESESAPRHLYTHIDIELTHRSEGARREYASAAELLADTATVAALLRRGAIWCFFAHGRHGHIALESRTLALLEARTVERISGPSLEWVASTADALRAAARTSAAFALCLWRAGRSPCSRRAPLSASRARRPNGSHRPPTRCAPPPEPRPPSRSASCSPSQRSRPSASRRSPKTPPPASSPSSPSSRSLRASCSACARRTRRASCSTAPHRTSTT